MKGFPKTPQFSGLNQPVRIELSVKNLEVEGEIPAEIEGAFFRAVGDPAHTPMFDDDILWSADGMVSRFFFENGHVDYDIRYVHTARYKAEKKARKSLFGKYRNPFTDHPSVEGVDRTLANTTPVWHANRLFMTKEDGRAYEINPHSLETIGSWDYHGALKSQTMTAHPRIDPETGELFFFGYEANGLCSKDIAYCIADKTGELISEQWFQAPYCSMMHDFAITDQHTIFPIFPTTTDLDRLKQGGAHWVHEHDLESYIGIMPRYGKVEEMRWFKGPKGVSAFHIINAFTEGSLVHMDFSITDTNVMPFIHDINGPENTKRIPEGGLVRWTFDLSKEGQDFETKEIGPPGDMPRLRDADQGKPYESAWYLSMNPQGYAPLQGGPVGPAFNALLRVEPNNGRVDMMVLDPAMAINEPVHVPADNPEHEGWLLAVLDRQVDEDDYRSELWIIDAGNISKGPVARVKIPVRTVAQVHGCWVPAESLIKAKK